MRTTAKPVGLLEALLKNSTQRGDVVIDPFLGSGSALIAAERLGRRCVGVELDPRYAHVAVRRWERFTGQSAQLIERN
ncbi:MAG: site-specific DNA-methyltransferase [Dehalococcoidia bacterium]|nr:site-specific DNA-methyltransferase [Dehalococcoidia bacterium]